MKNLVLYAIIGSSALAVGAGGGIIYKRFIVDPVQQIKGFNPEACKPDAKTLIEEVEKVGSKEKAVEQFAPVDIANYALEKYKTYEHSVSCVYGTAHTVVEQEIRNVQIRNGNTFFEESVSKSSMVGIGKRMIQEGIDGDVKLYNEKSKNDVSISVDKVHTEFKTNPDNVKNEDYKKMYGRNLPDMFIYCIHNITVLNGSIDKDGDGYKVTLELDPVMGGYQYRYQMQTISNLSSLPTFESIKLTYTLDKNLDLKHISADEKYKATMGMTVDIHNNLETYCCPNVEYKIPELGEDINYAEVKEMAK